MHQAPPAAPQPELDHVRGEPRPESLGAGYHATLIPGQVAEGRRKLTLHSPECDARHRHLAGRPPIAGRIRAPGRLLRTIVPQILPRAPILPVNPVLSKRMRSTVRLGREVLDGSVIAWETRGWRD